MQVVLLQILLWILRIILILLLLMIVLIAMIMIVPIRYRVEGQLHEKKPGLRGKVTWFFYLIHMKFIYEKEFHISVRVFGFKVYDSLCQEKSVKEKKSKKTDNIEENKSDNSVGLEETTVKDTVVSVESPESVFCKNNTEGFNGNTEELQGVGNSSEELQGISHSGEDELAAWEREVKAQEKEEEEFAKKVIKEQEKRFGSKKNKSRDSSNKDKTNKKSLDERIEDFKIKIQGIIEKVKEILKKIQDGKLKVEHYLELWNRKETQITFQRAKRKFGKVLKALLPKKWKLLGNIGFQDPATTGKLMGAIGAMYPILGNNVQIVPDFENEVIELEGNMKGHVRLGNLTYQLISLLLNPHCFKFIKLVFDELGSSKKRKKEI